MRTKRFIMASAATVVLQFIPCPAQAQSAKVLIIHDEATPADSRYEIGDVCEPVPEPGKAGMVIPQMEGWPKRLGCHPAYYPLRGLVFADLNQDGAKEIIMSGTDSLIYAWDYTGVPVPGFPVETEGICLNPPSVADLDNDGYMEIVQLTRGVLDGGRLYILDHCGSPLPGFPKSLNNNNLAGSATLVDLDNDGFLEIIVSERAIPIGYLHIFEIDGTEWDNGWPVTLDNIPTGTAAVGDIDADGALEIVYLSYTSVYVLETSGAVVAGWPRHITDTCFSYQSPALADLDHDGDLEIVLSAHKSAAGCYVFHHDGTPMPGWPQLLDTWTYCPPTITDLEGDGELEILAGRAGNNSPTSPCFWAWNNSGAVKEGFPYASQHGGGF
ncbi:MAG: VCBS repeat-containing protein [Planctomycetota bacterium]